MTTAALAVPTRGLTVRPPFSWATVHGGKTTENRTRLTAHRGPVALHAGHAWSLDGAADPLVLAAFAPHRHPDDDPTTPIRRLTYPHAWHAGHIVAVAYLAACHRVTVDAAGDVTCCTDPWALAVFGGQPVRAHLVWGQITPLSEPVPARGALGFWPVPPRAARAIAAQLEHVSDPR